MNSRERIIATLCCQKTDRVPLPFWLGFSPWGETKSRWCRESGIADLNVTTHFEFEPFFKVAPMEYGPCPHLERREISRDSEFVVSTDYRGITMRNRLDHGSMPEFIGHPIQNHDAWKRYKEAHLQPQLEARTASLGAYLDGLRGAMFRCRWGRFPGAYSGRPAI